jgi:LysM repeat protein
MGFAYAKGSCPFCGADFLSDTKGLAIQKFYNELFTCFGDKLDMDRIFIILDFIYSPGSELIVELLQKYRDTFNEIAAAVIPTREAVNPQLPPLAKKETVKAPKKISRVTEEDSTTTKKIKKTESYSRAQADYSIPEAELAELSDDLRDFGRNVKTKADYDMFLKMVAESMITNSSAQESP